MLHLLFFATPPGFCQNNDGGMGGGPTATARDMPVVRWTADRDDMRFRYDFLERTETLTLYTATPETGTWNHHPHITLFNGALFASWDRHIRDENASGQHGLLRRSLDLGKTWTPEQELFPSLDKMAPAASAHRGTRSSGASPSPTCR